MVHSPDELPGLMSESLERWVNPEDYYEEEMYDYEQYPDEYSESDRDYQMIPMSLFDVSQACVFPTVSAVSKVYVQMFGVCFGFQILNRIPFMNSTVKHALSFSLGFFLLWMNHQTLISHSIIISLVSYLLIFALKYSTITISISLLTYLTACEFMFEDGNWARVRSIQMILVMKIISLVSDLENGRIHQAPTRVQYLGFLFSVSNCIHGPWMSFSAYLDIIHPKPLNRGYFTRFVFCVFSSLICFVLSTCYFDWLLPDDFGSLLFMYKHAVIFRCSHYFVMLMSESFLLAAGYETNDTNALVNPSRIEVPKSLVEVVIYWNVPMHIWLKTYIFKPLWKHGHFTAIMSTYFVSSLLHGLNYQLSGILLSLAIYTYIENMIRKKLAQKLDACVLSKSCPSGCEEHRYTHRFPFVKLFNLMFTFIAIYHLSYLGCLIDLQNDRKLSFEESFQRWRDQSYSSHLLALVTAVIYLFL